MRAAWLAPSDRQLVEQVIGRGVRPSSIAAVQGVSSRVVQRRLARLIDRLTDEEALVVMRTHDRWPAKTASVALSVWVRGRSQRQAARELGLSLHDVRKHVHIVRGLLAARSGGRR